MKKIRLSKHTEKFQRTAHQEVLSKLIFLELIFKLNDFFKFSVDP